MKLTMMQYRYVSDNELVAGTKMGSNVMQSMLLNDN